MAHVSRLPTIYLPHGGGPCFFMDWDPPDAWTRMADYLRGLPASLPAAPKALLVISAHWESAAATVTTAPEPPLIYDYYGFPPHTYQLKWPAPGSPELAARVRALLGGRLPSSTPPMTRAASTMASSCRSSSPSPTRRHADGAAVAAAAGSTRPSTSPSAARSRRCATRASSSSAAA